MSKRIIIVDDDPGVIYTVKHGIENMDADYEIIPVDNGRKCLELLEKEKIPDLILIDIMMPVMNGWELHQQIREQFSEKELPIVFLTARTDRIAKNAGGFLASDYIEKPFKIPELKERIEKILKKNKQ